MPLMSLRTMGFKLVDVAEPLLEVAFGRLGLLPLEDGRADEARACVMLLAGDVQELAGELADGGTVSWMSVVGVGRVLYSLLEDPAWDELLYGRTRSSGCGPSRSATAVAAVEEVLVFLFEGNVCGLPKLHLRRSGLMVLGWAAF